MDHRHLPMPAPVSPTWYTDAATAAHHDHCEPCRTQDTQWEAAWAERRAANGASIRRRNRTQLGLNLATDSDPNLNEALRRARAARTAVTR